MKIVLNNREEEFKQDSLTVSELLDSKNFTFRMLVIKINNNLVRREYYDKKIIKAGDNVSVIHLISGG